ncbi:MAG: hypothetical protein C0608_00415 [Deltaproteobacteria bacterium]|nr:MAG: hypothetical protein C0608_00415 [Deltaproteobacteria bacterium]
MRLLFAALLALALAAPANSAPLPPDDAAGINSFGEALLGLGESYRAATEFMRVLHHFPEDRENSQRALTGLGRAYTMAGRWEEAAGVYSNLLKSEPSETNRHRLGATLYRAGRYNPAISILSSDKSDAMRTLATLAWLKEGNFSEQPPNLDTRLIDEFKNLPQKSKTTAGVLSAVLPGAGHYYVDRPLDGTIALVVNGLFIWGTVNAAQNGREELAVTLGAIELIWYSGTITGAVAGAAKWNHREKERFFSRHEQGAFPSWSIIPIRGGGALAWTGRW